MLNYLKKNKFLTIILIFFSTTLFYFLVIHECETFRSLERSTLTSEASSGCVLISPFEELLEDNFFPAKKERVFLLNKFSKRVVHSWTTDFAVFISKIDPQGLIWLSTKLKWSPSSPTEIIAMDSKSNVQHRIVEPGIRHDFALRTSSSIFYTKYKFIPVYIENTFVDFKSDIIKEFNIEKKKVVWEYDLLRSDLAPLFKVKNSQQIKSRDLTHINSVRFYESNPINGKPAVLFILRNLSIVVILDYETKTVLWKSDPHMFEFPHDASLLPNGQLLIFNNRRLSSYSTVDQLDVLENKLVWQYRSVTDNEFHSAILGGAQRLPNGNTLITDGKSGHLFEINGENKIVWEYFQDLEKRNRDSAWPISFIFRAEQISSELTQALGVRNLCI